jgi:hypothetical protein
LLGRTSVFPCTGPAKPTEGPIGEPPAIFVSDLYLPSSDYDDTVSDFAAGELKRQAEKAAEIGIRSPAIATVLDLETSFYAPVHSSLSC